MLPIALPKLPKGKEFEEYISAFFQSNGYYIERNVEETDLLELDIIITDYDSSLPEINLLEAKSGNWGFSDIFKVRGWMDYLNINKGIFISSKERDKLNFYKEKANLLKIDLKIIPDLNKTEENLLEYKKRDVKEYDISTLRFSYWIERNLLKHLKVRKKSSPAVKRFKTLEFCYYTANDRVFFTENIFKRIDNLYLMFEIYPHLSARCGNEINGNNFNDPIKKLPYEIYRKTYYNCEYNDIQISTFIEHKMRLTILKNAIDYKLYEREGIESLIKDEYFFKDLEIKTSDFLPDSFKKGLDKISDQEYFHKYPVFWQWFLWVFGGFILKDYEDQEFEILSLRTGIPIDEIPNALKSYELLFPIKDGWFVDLSPNSNIKLIKMFSVPFMGVGAYYRKRIYKSKIEELKVSGTHTLNDLIRWYGLGHNVLKEYYTF